MQYSSLDNACVKFKFFISLFIEQKKTNLGPTWKPSELSSLKLSLTSVFRT